MSGDLGFGDTCHKQQGNSSFSSNQLSSGENENTSGASTSKEVSFSTERTSRTILPSLLKEPVILANQETNWKRWKETPYAEKSSEHEESMSASNKEDSDLQKAIALSLEQSNAAERISSEGKAGKKVTWGDIGISNEDTDINKALEESLKTNRPDENSLYAFEGNPYERKRGKGDWPLGLQNIGNTCWFSSVIQALFNISAFRNLVLNFNPPLNAAAQPNPQSASAKKYFQFMKELRCLFAYLIGSTRKYVNPRKSVEILKGAFEGSAYSNSQQDVSEFTSKLLEWVEEALKIYKASLDSVVSTSDMNIEDSSPKNSFSPDQMLIQLKGIFYGEMETHGLTDKAEVFETKEPFIQLPLQVRGFQTLYDSIDASLQSEFTSANAARGEQWITKLPKVVIFNLNRFIFNPSTQRTEKIHDKLQFPDVLYFDRFMVPNQSVTRDKRKKVAELKGKLMHLDSQLISLQEYGSKGIPLKDGLQCVLDYASCLQKQNQLTSSNRDTTAGLNNVEMGSPGKSSVNSLSDDVAIDLNSERCFEQAKDVLAADKLALERSNLLTVVNTLSLWKSRVNREIQELEASIQEINEQIEVMYNQEALKTIPYKLHAVLVHEGEALSGHYWCFVQPRRDHSSAPHSAMPTWLKYNDTHVTSAKKGDVHAESFGGSQATRSTCSAYCLIYVDTRSNDIFEENGNVSLESLPEDLRTAVQEDNEVFRKELDNWTHSRDQTIGPDTSSGRQPQKFFAVAERDSDNLEGSKEEHEDCAGNAYAKFNSQVMMTGVNNHTSTPRETTREEGDEGSRANDRLRDFNFALSAIAMRELVREMAPQFTETLNNNNNAFAQVFKFAGVVRNKFDQMSKIDAGPASRLTHIAYFGLPLCLDAVVINRCILETLCLIDADSLPECIAGLQTAARRFLDEWTWSPDMVAVLQYNQLHHDFFQLYRVVTRFSEGFSQFQEGRHRVALPQFINALEINSQGENDPRRRFDESLLFYFRRICFINLNQEALDQFQSEERSEQLEGLRLAQEFVIPVAGSLCKSNASGTPCSENMQAVELVRDQWFSLLNSDIAQPLVEKFQDVLSKLTDESSLIDLAYKVDSSILTRSRTDLRLKKVSSLLSTVGEAIAFRNSKTDEIMDMQ